MTCISKHLARQGRKGGSVQSAAKKAAAKIRAAKLWADRRAGLAPLPLFRRYREEPCLDAVQIGATADGQAVWQRGQLIFRTVYAEDDSFELFAVPEEQIARRHVRAIPWAEILKGQQTSTTKDT